MVKKTKKERAKANAKRKARERATENQTKGIEIECKDCHWKGHAIQLIWNSHAGWYECPNCTGHDFDYEKPKMREDAKRLGMTAYCLKCEWEGELTALVTATDTANDLCPSCLHGGISYAQAGVGSVFPKKKKKNKKTPKFEMATSCYESHPPLRLGDHGEIYGGSCIRPAHTACDIYIGLDHAMQYTDRSFPWTYGNEFLYSILDGKTPRKKENFRKLIVWVAQSIHENKSIHVGCIGGHGRTGMFLAALVAYLEVDDDPIAYVRKHYCDRAVESVAQINYLHKEFGCPKAEGSKSAAYGPDATISEIEQLY